ncbi:MAG TPA: 3-oxoadipate enol-lactonase [Terriglobales bacterium]|nr:3-oxoadipate enol-lactonase [Terriglobales bacterium]
MPFVTMDGTRLFYRLEGNDGLPVLVLSHSMGADHQMWAPQASDLLPYFKILRFDTRGHGASDAPAGEYSIERLGRDVLALTDHLGVSKFAFCGLSLGGAIGQWIAIHASDRLSRLVLANTSPRFGPPASWQERMQAVERGGMAAIVDTVTERFFSPQSLAQKKPFIAGIRSVLLGTNPQGYAGCCAALRDTDYSPALRQIKLPTLVITGELDLSTPWSGHGEILAREISGARAIQLPAAHLSNLERPRSFSAALLEFLLPPPPTADSFEAGIPVRRAVLGDEHVDRAQAATNDFTREFQTLITRFAWGTIWSRPFLDWRTRRLLVLSTMASLGRWEEFRMHLRAGLAKELESCDLKEVLLQTAIYAGVPVANTAFQIAREELEDQRSEAKSQDRVSH